MCRIAIESMVWTAIDTGTSNETRVGAVSTRSHDPLGSRDVTVEGLY